MILVLISPKYQTFVLKKSQDKEGATNLNLLPGAIITDPTD